MLGREFQKGGVAVRGSWSFFVGFLFVDVFIDFADKRSGFEPHDVGRTRLHDLCTFDTSQWSFMCNVIGSTLCRTMTPSARL